MQLLNQKSELTNTFPHNNKLSLKCLKKGNRKDDSMNKTIRATGLLLVLLNTIYYYMIYTLYIYIYI